MSETNIAVRGLSSKQASDLLNTQGFNELPQKHTSLFVRIVKRVISPVSLMLIAAGILSLFAQHIPDAILIAFLFVINIGLSVLHEHKADKSIEKLAENLSLQVSTLRDGNWQTINSKQLVAGDVIRVSQGSIIPADGTVIEPNNLSLNESALTGESLPIEKAEGDTVYSGAYVSTGFSQIAITATGVRTYFGKTLASVEKSSKRSLLEQDIMSISGFLAAVSIIVIIPLSIVLWLEHFGKLDILILDTSLLIAGIPVALPTVMTLIISIGVLRLSEKQSVVRRLSALEDLANVNLLLTDKTGTLTQNTIYVERVIPLGNYTEQDIAQNALLAITEFDGGNIDDAIRNWTQDKDIQVNVSEIASYTPGDSSRKRSTAVLALAGGASATISLGAPQVVLDLCAASEAVRELVTNKVTQAAENGFRSLMLARSSGKEEKDMQPVGLLLLSDRLHANTKEVIDFMLEKGIDVKMVSGDSFAISSRIAGEVGLTQPILAGSAYKGNSEELIAQFDKVSGFSEILPEDKYKIVSFAKHEHMVAVTGDGVNDLPAVKIADVGIAVKNAVDALKSTADIVLLSEGLAVIKDAIIEARKIFVRLYNYSVYRISESFRVIIAIAIIGLVYKDFPLTPIQLILLSLLNDIPIISLAFDKVEHSSKPAVINRRERIKKGVLFGCVGIVSSIAMVYILASVIHLPWDRVQTAFFLKMAVSGHLLIYIAHTDRPWYRYWPSKEVISATLITQIIATLIAAFGIFFTPISWLTVGLIWLWSILWMQITDIAKRWVIVPATESEAERKG